MAISARKSPRATARALPTSACTGVVTVRAVHVALASGVSALILATIISPIATELPEKFNSVIWVRQRKDTLALGNITGAMVFQSSIPTSIGILFTDWSLNPHALAAGIAAIAASFFAWAELRISKKLTPYSLMAGIIFYIGFLIYTFS
jgi:cation:H+ antiporter